MLDEMNKLFDRYSVKVGSPKVWVISENRKKALSEEFKTMMANPPKVLNMEDGCQFRGVPIVFTKQNCVLAIY
jgi:hypothetical protein